MLERSTDGRSKSAPIFSFSSTVVAALILVSCAVVPARAQNLGLSTSSGGVTIGGSKPNWTGGFGSINGFGIGTPGTGVTVITSGVTGGALYTTPVNFVVTGAGGPNRAVVRAHVSTNHTHPTVLQLKVCYPASGCASAANYQTISLSSGTPTDVIAPTGVGNGTYIVWFGVFVSNLNGASAFSGADPATVTLRSYNHPNNVLNDTDTLALSKTVQTAVRFTLATAGGLTVSPGSDFSVAFGSVNGLGIAPGAGVTVSFPAGGALYATPYSIQPEFASFSSTNGTVNAYVSVDFAHPSILELRDSSNGSTFNAISKIAGSPTVISSTLSSGSANTRYLGLFVSGTNGAGAFTGADSAGVRFTLVAP